MVVPETLSSVRVSARETRRLITLSRRKRGRRAREKGSGASDSVRGDRLCDRARIDAVSERPGGGRRKRARYASDSERDFVFVSPFSHSPTSHYTATRSGKQPPFGHHTLSLKKDTGGMSGLRNKFRPSRHSNHDDDPLAHQFAPDGRNLSDTSHPEYDPATDPELRQSQSLSFQQHEERAEGTGQSSSPRFIPTDERARS